MVQLGWPPLTTKMPPNARLAPGAIPPACCSQVGRAKSVRPLLTVAVWVTFQIWVTMPGLARPRLQLRSVEPVLSSV